MGWFLAILTSCVVSSQLVATASVICDAEQLTANAQSFFDACEQGRANDTKAYIATPSIFHAQVTDALPGPPLSKVKTVADYAEWMAGVAKEFPTAKPTVYSRAIDELRSMVIFYATFLGSDYVYILGFEPTTCKVKDMTKVWNDDWASKHMPP